MNETALQHHGIKGQRWGIRRYQNKDGSLTALGRKREEKDKLKSANKELKALRAENEKLKKQTSANSRRVNELSDDELRQRINRLNMEKQYNDIYNQLHPNKPNPGKEFAINMLKDKVVPAVIDTTTKLVKKSLGLEGKPDLSKQLDLEIKKLDRDMKISDLESRKVDRDTKKVDQDIKKVDLESKQYDLNEKKKRGQNNNTNDQKADTDKTVYEEPEVIFNANKKSADNSKSSSKRSNSDTIYEAEWTDITPSEAKSTDVAVYGKSFVTALLESRYD